MGLGPRPSHDPATRAPDERPGAAVNRWDFHWCLLDAECREWGAPNRIHVFTPRWVLIVGIGWDNRIQAWLPRRGYLSPQTRGSWWPVVVHPRHTSKGTPR